MLRLSFRYQLGLTLVVVNLLLTAGLALVAYRAAHDAMVDQSLRAVSLVARGRERELLNLLERRRERLVGFLQSLRSLCGETGPSGGLGWEDECVRAAVGGFHRSERALSTDVSYRNRRLARVGKPLRVPAPLPSRLVRIDAVAGMGQYSMAADMDDLDVHAEFSLDDVNAVFADRAGLESNGEAFLTDADGYRLTAAGRAKPEQARVPIPGVTPCIGGAAQATRSIDDRGVPVIAGLLPATALGGGCIVANVSYDDATAPVRRLGRLLAYASGLVGLIGGVVSVLIATIATRPLKRLAAAATKLGDGALDTRVPVEGPSEMRQLGQTLSRMAASIRELVGRERHARKGAEEANRTKDEFLTTLSHELRTPLNAILGWASILSRRDYDWSRAGHAVHVIERNARIQLQMVEDLLDVSRIAAGTVQLHASEVAVGAIVEAALESVRPAADAKGVTLVKRLDVPELTINADPRRIQQVVWNLLSNAVRFTPGGGRVEVTLVRDGDHVELCVADTGCGIAAEFLPQVFERFKQADSSTMRTPGGLGLGLAIVWDLVELHGGTVRANSAGDGQGATFCVRLPATPAPPATMQVDVVSEPSDPTAAC